MSRTIEHSSRVGSGIGFLGGSVLLIVFALLQPFVSVAADPKTYLIADFEGPAALEHWHFSDNPESPAVSGALSVGPGHDERGAVLTYQLGCDRTPGCDTYAEAVWRPESSVPKARQSAICLWIRIPPDVEVSILVEDTDGRSVRFPVRATLEYSRPGEWQYVVVPISGKLSFAEAPLDGSPIRGRLVELRIRVQAVAQAAVKGSISFDDVELREFSEAFYADREARIVAPPVTSPVSAPSLGVNIHVLRDEHSLDLARSVGFRFVRMDLLWANVERRGRYRFVAYDALLRALEARGMGVLWILDYGHPDHGGSTPRTQEDVTAFGRFAEAAAAHFKGHDVRYEIWNEPNTSQFWPPSPNASEYATLLREALEGIRRADPSAQVSSGGLSRFDGMFLSRLIDQSLAGGLTAIGIHPYPMSGPESIAPEYGLLRQWVGEAFGKQLEIWDTEWGYSSTDASREGSSNGHADAARRRQAALAVREILTVTALGLPLAVWYDLRDDGPDPVNPEQNYGLIDARGDEKPAMKAIRTLMTAMSSRKYAGMIGGIPPGIHGMEFESSGDGVLVVWTSQPGVRQTVEYIKRNFVSVTDMMGETIKPKNRPSGKALLEINEASGPIYLLWALRS